jgi:hypothetical protein
MKDEKETTEETEKTVEIGGTNPPPKKDEK